MSDQPKDEMAFDIELDPFKPGFELRPYQKEVVEKLKEMCKDARITLSIPSRFDAFNGRPMKRDDLVFVTSGPRTPDNTGRTTLWYEFLKRRAEKGLPWTLEFTDMEWSPGLYNQSIGRLKRRWPTTASRRQREGHYIGSRKGKSYRSKVIQYDYPVVCWQQVEREIWARAEKEIE